MQKALDREVTPQYKLEIRATDGVQASSALVSIDLTDVNDEPPVFTEPWYALTVLEDARTGKSKYFEPF